MAGVPLQYPTIDPRNEAQLVEQAIAAVYGYSGGALNDFSSSGPLRVLLEGLCFASAELLYYCNKIVDAIVVSYLSNYGITRNLGTTAIATLQITLSASFSNPITIPAGYIVQSQSGRVTFVTTQQLVLPPGAISGTVPAIAQQIGKAGNVAAGSINQPLQPLAYVAGVTNLSPATGGSDEETQQEAIDRGIAQIRRRNLVSADDYEAEAIALLGVGAVAKAVGNLAGDKISQQLGSVHVFALDAEGSKPNPATLTQIQTAMESRVMIGTVVWVSPIETIDADIKLIARIVEGEDPVSVSRKLYEALKAYTAPGSYPIGLDLILNEVEYALRRTGLIEYVESVTINNIGGNLGMPNDWSMPIITRLYSQLVDASGNVYRNLNGQFDDGVVL
jgi:hypothetical protein